MKRLTTALGTALVCLFIPLRHATSQVPTDTAGLPNDSIPFAPLVHPSYFWVGWPDNAWYEGDVGVPVHLWSRTAALRYPDRVKADAYDCWGMIGKLGRSIEKVILGSSMVNQERATGCTITFVPHFVLRQLSGGSAPVQTPTFNPAFEFTRWVMHLDDTATVNARRAVRGRAWRNASLTGTHLRFGHYSNGQSGCLYANQDPDSACAVIPGVPETLNTTDGSFSTHYIEPALTFARLRMDSTGHERRLSSLTLGFRQNIGGADYGGMSDELARTYGWQSFTASYVMRHRFEREGRLVMTLLAQGECARGRPEPYDTCRGAVGLSASLPSMYGFGVGLRYVGGWDYYNVGYGESLRNQFMVGIVLDHTLPIVIRR
jgi:hypothetical protein